MINSKTTDNKEKATVGITVKIDKNDSKILSAMLALKGMTLSAFLQKSIKNFIRENYQDVKKLFNSFDPDKESDSKISKKEGINNE